MTENPFVFGKVVKGKHFCNRENEMKQIRNFLKSNQHIVIISPRRYGKTSLVINALERNGIRYLYLDCSFVEDEKDLVSLIVNEYAKKIDNIAILEKFLKRFDFSFTITVNPASVTITQVKNDTLASTIRETGKNYVLVFDEFQDIYGKDPNLVKKVRSTVQFMEKSIIVLGSKRHLLTLLFLKPRGIFYNFGYALNLEKISPEKFEGFVSDWFKINRIAITPKEIRKVLGISGCHPFFTQYLCHFLFERAKTGDANAENTLKTIIDMNTVFYDETYRNLTATQQKALLVLSADTKEVYAAETLKKFGLKSSQALQKALKSLERKELVDKNGAYFVVDIFFKHWLYQRVLNQMV